MNPLVYVPENHEEIAFKYAISIGYQGAKDSKQLLSYFKKLPLEAIMARMLTRFHHSVYNKVGTSNISISTCIIIAIGELT